MPKAKWKYAKLKANDWLYNSMGHSYKGERTGTKNRSVLRVEDGEINGEFFRMKELFYIYIYTQC